MRKFAFFPGSCRHHKCSLKSNIVKQRGADALTALWDDDADLVLAELTKRPWLSLKESQLNGWVRAAYDNTLPGSGATAYLYQPEYYNYCMDIARTSWDICALTPPESSKSWLSLLGGFESPVCLRKHWSFDSKPSTPSTTPSSIRTVQWMETSTVQLSGTYSQRGRLAMAKRH